jgi:hypothetical protein
VIQGLPSRSGVFAVSEGADELGEEHICFLVGGVIERLDMSVFEQIYGSQGGDLDALELMLSVWLYAYALGVTSAQQVQRRLVEDLAFRHLAGGESLANWALSGRRASKADAPLIYGSGIFVQGVFGARTASIRAS